MDPTQHSSYAGNDGDGSAAYSPRFSSRESLGLWHEAECPGDCHMLADPQAQEGIPTAPPMVALGSTLLGSAAGKAPMPRTDAQLSCPLANLPAELVDGILAFLSPVDLVAISQTCRALRKHAISDALWQPLVQENVPGVRLRSPYPFKSYRELYSTHDPKWFLPKYKVWFCDRDLVGKLIIVRYDQRRGCIEGHQLVAVSNHTHHQNWSENHHVIIHAFEPRVMLHEDKPVIKFSATINPESSRAHELMGGKRGFQAEVPMIIDENPNNMHCNLLLTRPLESQAITQNARRPFPYGHLWPPPAIPSRQHVTGTPAFNDEHHLLARPELPTSRAESSDVTFRIRQWIHMGGSPPTRLIYGQGLETLMQTLTGQVTPPRGPGTGSHLVDFPGLTSVNLGEEVITYSTLDPALYTPTDLKPWRGIWVGDYSAHGCEFLLIHQPDDVVATDEDLGLVRSEGEPEAAWEKRRRDARIYRGRLEAIKLTGDPNIPRGEYTFVAEDLGLGGFVGVAEEHPFYGARVVRSQGHIARSGFQGDEFVESRLLLISPNRIAQYWLGFGHISFFERVDIDQFLDPEQSQSL